LIKVVEIEGEPTEGGYVVVRVESKDNLLAAPRRRGELTVPAGDSSAPPGVRGVSVIVDRTCVHRTDTGFPALVAPGEWGELDGLLERAGITRFRLSGKTGSPKAWLALPVAEAKMLVTVHGTQRISSQRPLEEFSWRPDPSGSCMFFHKPVGQLIAA
jgi:hypothetical protein